MKVNQWRAASLSEMIKIIEAVKKVGSDDFRKLYYYLKDNYGIKISKKFYDEQKKKYLEDQLLWNKSSFDIFYPYWWHNCTYKQNILI